MYFRGIKAGNEKFAKDVAAWTFQESLVLRIDNTTHHLVHEATSPEMYTTNDRIVRPFFIIFFKNKLEKKT